MSMTKSEIRKIASIVEEAANKALKEAGYDVNVDYTGGRYTDAKFDMKLRVNLTGDDNELAKKEFNRQCAAVGLHPAHFGQKFHFNGSDWELVGVNTRAYKYPLLAVNQTDGKKYKLPRAATTAIWEAAGRNG